MKSILVAAGGARTDTAVFATAHAVACATVAHLDFLHLSIDPSQAISGIPHGDFATGQGLVTLMARLTHDGATRNANARLHFEEFCRSHGIDIADEPQLLLHVTGSYSAEIDDALDVLVRRSRRHDLTVVGRQAQPNGLPRYFLEQLLLRSGKPLLLAPPRTPATVGTTAVVCWKEGPAAARALTAALPLLAKADDVFVLAVSEDNATTEDDARSVARSLAWHGISARYEFLAPAGRQSTDVLLSRARELGADLLVMGGYGKPRLHEVVFGGFTQSMLAGCDIATLIVH